MSSPFTLAIVDDDPAIRRLLRLLISRAGYQTFECTTGTEARERLRKEEWDLAILDRKLPDMDGVVLCHELKSDPTLRTRYIIMLTGEDEQADKVEGLELGADDYITKPFQSAELLARVRAAKRIIDLQKELLQTNKRLELLSITDGLTKLHNHRHFQDELNRAFEESARYERPLSLAMIDIDFLEKVNDTHGHAVGDEVLKAVARLFGESVRSTDLVARYGGEEFAVMMPETTLDDGAIFAEKIRSLVESTPIETQAGPVKATVSIGVASVHAGDRRPAPIGAAPFSGRCPRPAHRAIAVLTRAGGPIRSDDGWESADQSSGSPPWFRGRRRSGESCPPSKLFYRGWPMPNLLAVAQQQVEQ